jgi:dTDP-4-amino-4,6-dideoxygalactose transaminase
MSEAVPLLDLKRQFKSIEDELMSAVQRVCQCQGFILGPEVEQFEQAVAQYCNVQHGIGVSSGTDALIVALLAAGVGEGDEVITSPFSFFASASSIVRVGARPVFADVDPQTFNIDPEFLARVLNDRTKAIIPVHLFGQCAPMDRIRELAQARRIAVIEDAAQAIGAQYKGAYAGSLGHMGCFSFFPSKNLGGFGDGGMVVTNDSAAGELCKSLRMHGETKRYIHEMIGGNFRLDALQAAVLGVKLKYLDQWAEGRRTNAETYSKLFVDAGLVDLEQDSLVGGSKPVVLPTEHSDCRHIYNQYVIRARDRDALRNYLSEQKVGVQVYYPLGLHMQPCFSYLEYSEGDFPQCELATKEVLALPVFPELGKDELQRVVALIAEFYSR